MLYEEFQQAIKDSKYGSENYCIYYFCFGEFGEYIGKVEEGCLYNRYNTGNMSKKVKKAVDSCPISDFKIEILHRDKDINSLCEKEIELISKLNPQTKLNTHKGGIITDDKIPRKFQNLETGEIVEKACCDMARDYGGTPSSYSQLILKRIKYSNIWCLPESYEEIKKEGKHGKRFWFKHKITLKEEYLTCYEMSRKYNISNTVFSSLCLNKMKHCNNWCLRENFNSLQETGWLKNGAIRYYFYNKTTEETEYLSCSEMARKYNGNNANFNKITKGKCKSAYGWTLAE